MTRKAKESICGSISAEQKRGGGDSPPNSRDEKFGNYGQSSTKYSQLKIFQSVNIFFAKWNSFFSIQEFLFHKENFFSQTARCSPTPMSLGSSASFRRIVPSRDTSTTESEIPSFRDAKPHGQPLFPSPYPPPRFCLAMG